MKKLEDNKKILLIGSVFTAMITVGMCIQMFSLSYSSIMREFCIGKVELGMLGSFLLAGMGIGGMVAGFLADIYGRLKVVRGALVILPLANFMVIFSKTYLWLSIACFLTGMFVISLYYIGTLVVSENVDTKIRAAVLGTIQAGWSLGYIVAALASSFFSEKLGWRSLFLIPVFSSFASLIMINGVDESKSYIINMTTSGKKFGSIERLLCDFETRRLFVLWGITLFALQFGYYGFSTWLPLYFIEDLGVDFSKSGLYVAGIYSAMFFGKILTGMATYRIGRKKLWVIVGIATSFLLPIVVLIVNSENIFYLMPLFGLFYGAPYAILSTYLSESFPASVRGIAVAATNTVGKAGSLVSPLFIGILSSRWSISIGLASLGIAYMVSAVIPGIFIKDNLYDPCRISKV